MNSIYFHFPFCKKRCGYCSFYAEVSQIPQKKLINALIKEIKLRKNYLINKNLNTIYIGGGTPSLLGIAELEQLLISVTDNFSLLPNIEITIEVNPEDVTIHYLSEIKSLNINRLSIGIQSFCDYDLQSFFSRRHNATQAIQSIDIASKVGFDNISIDLIYGFDGLTLSRWEENLMKTFAMPIQHISAYHLSIDNGTQIYKKWLKKKIKIPSENESWEQFVKLLELTEKHEFDQYELSNFCKRNYLSQHNSAYWKQKHYLGIGPSAHSYNSISRQWNISNTQEYIDRIQKKQPFYRIERLSLNDRFNDYVMLRLRTNEGLNVKSVKNQFGESFYKHCLHNVDKYTASQHIVVEGNMARLTRKGMFVSNTITTDFFMI